MGETLGCFQEKGEELVERLGLAKGRVPWAAGWAEQTCQLWEQGACRLQSPVLHKEGAGWRTEGIQEGRRRYVQPRSTTVAMFQGGTFIPMFTFMSK